MTAATLAPVPAPKVVVTRPAKFKSHLPGVGEVASRVASEAIYDDGTTVYLCNKCGYTSETVSGVVHGHQRQHSRKTAQEHKAKGDTAADRALAALDVIRDAITAPQDTTEVDRWKGEANSWKTRALAAEKKLGTLQRALRAVAA